MSRAIRTVTTLGVFLYGSLLLSATAYGATTAMKVPCSDLKSTPSYGVYGLKQPEGWTCTATSFDKGKTYTLFKWENGDKQINIGEYEEDKSAFQGFEKEIPDPAAKYPMNVIRYNVEAFLGDEKVIKKSEFMAMSASMFQPKAKAVLFSPDNQRTLIYINDGLSSVGGKERTKQTAQVFSKARAGFFLNPSCVGCTSDEFFSLIINPLIQK